MEPLALVGADLLRGSRAEGGEGRLVGGCDFEIDGGEVWGGADGVLAGGGGVVAIEAGGLGWRERGEEAEGWEEEFQGAAHGRTLHW